MKRTFPHLLLMALILSSAGCWHGRLLVCAEQPFWATLGEDWRLKVSIYKDSVLKGYFPEFMVIGPEENPLEALSTALSARHFAAAIVTPLLSFQAAAMAGQHPEVAFILVGGPPAEDSLGNTVQLLFDRTDAFRTAGRIVGLSLREAAGANQSAPLVSLASKIAILVPASRLPGERGVDPFQSGVAESLDGGQAMVVPIQEPIDQGRVTSAVKELKNRGVEIVFSRLSGADPYCLVALSEAGGSAVVSNWEVSQAFPEQVFLSVEEDVLAGISQSLGALPGAAGVVKGQVRIVCGKARSVPRGLTSEVDCR